MVAQVHPMSFHESRGGTRKWTHPSPQTSPPNTPSSRGNLSTVRAGEPPEDSVMSPLADTVNVIGLAFAAYLDMDLP